MINLELNPNSGVPTYRQIMEQITYNIAAGTLEEGDKLPSIRETAQHLSINPTTVVKAYSELENNGVIEKKQGKGAFVSENTPELSDDELEQTLREIARNLVVQAVQMKVSRETVLRIIREEFENIDSSSNDSPDHE